jgi:hypothetical protein
MDRPQTSRWDGSSGSAEARIAGDPVVGDLETLRNLEDLSREFLRPMLRAGSKPVGRIQDVDVDFVVRDYQYDKRAELLGLLDRNVLSFYFGALSTEYFASRRRNFARKARYSWQIVPFCHALVKLHQYRRLYRSIRRNGLLWEPGDVSSVPWLFASKESVCRLDGHHRASIARHLGHLTIKVLLITPKDVLPLPDLPDKFRAFLGGLHEPTVDLMQRPGASANPRDR